MEPCSLRGRSDISCLIYLCRADSRRFGLTCCWNEQRLSQFQPLFSNRPLNSSGIIWWLFFGSLILRMACYFPHTGASDTQALWFLAVCLYLLELSGMCCTWLPSSVEFLFFLSRGCPFNVIWETTSPNNKKRNYAVTTISLESHYSSSCR